MKYTTETLIDDCEFSARTVNALRNRSGIHTLGELSALTPTQIIKTPGMGKKSFTECKEILAGAGLHFVGDSPKLDRTLLGKSAEYARGYRDACEAQAISPGADLVAVLSSAESAIRAKTLKDASRLATRLEKDIVQLRALLVRLDDGAVIRQMKAGEDGR